MAQRAPEFDSGWVGAGPDDDLDRLLAEEDDAWDPARPFVGTVLGPVDPAALGPVLAGEPIEELAAAPDAVPADDAGWHALLAELEDAYASGIRTVVAEPQGNGSPGHGPTVVPWLAGRAPVHLVRLLLDADGDLHETLPPGWGGVAVADDAGGVAGRAVAAARRWGCPVRLVGTTAGDAVRAVERAVVAGAAVGRLSVSGAWAGDLGAARAVLGTGASVVVRLAGEAPAAVAEGLAGLVAEGHADRLLVTAGTRAPADLLARGGGRGFGLVMERLPLALMEAGLDATTVRRMLVENPARALTTGAPA